MLVNYDGLNRDLQNRETNTTYIKKTIIGETQPENINKKIIEKSNEPKLTSRICNRIRIYSNKGMGRDCKFRLPTITLL